MIPKAGPIPRRSPLSIAPPLTPTAMKLLVPLFATAALTSCVPGTYHRDFKRDTAGLPDPPVSPEGPWIGRWKSKANGHEGPLWCMVHPTPGQPGHYDFRYRAGWGALKFGDYVHPVETAPAADGSLPLDSAMELPGGFGTYRVKGKLTADAFDATYSSANDRGTMTLRRPR